MGAVGGGSPENDERPIILRVKRKASQSRFDVLRLEINRPLERTLLDLQKLSVSHSSAIAGGSSNSDERPVAVGVKRTASQSRLDALFAELEINERPFKRTSLDFGKLSISAISSIVEEFKTRKVLLCHIKTVANSEVPFDVLQSVVPASADASKFESKRKEIRRTFKARRYKHDQLQAKAKQSQEFASKNAQFMQIWRSRESKERAMHDESLHDKCQFYDVVRVDLVETNQEIPNNQKRGSEPDAHNLVSQYLPLLKEILPGAAMEIESDYASTHAPSDGFLYDIYVVNDEMNISELDVAQTLPLVQVDAEDDYNVEPHGSDNESSEENNEDGKSSEAQSKTDWISSDDQFSRDENDDDDDDDDDDEEEDWE